MEKKIKKMKKTIKNKQIDFFYYLIKSISDHKNDYDEQYG